MKKGWWKKIYKSSCIFFLIKGDRRVQYERKLLSREIILLKKISNYYLWKKITFFNW